MRNNNPNNGPDMDLLQLAGMTKSGLRGLDQSRVGSNRPTDHIDLKKLAGVGDPRRRPQGQPNTKKPNILGGFDFIEEPVSRPLGRVDMDGGELPPIPTQTAPDMIPIPEENRESVMAHLEEKPPEPKVVIPDASGEGFDLFQHAILKSIIDDLTKAIDAMDASSEDLKAKREKITKLMLGEI